MSDEPRELTFRTEDEDLVGRLHNWKFAQADKLIREDHPESVRTTVHALAETFGNPGWFMGGSLESVIDAALRFVYSELRHDR